jgi:hypothetical protein
MEAEEEDGGLRPKRDVVLYRNSLSFAKYHKKKITFSAAASRTKRIPSLVAASAKANHSAPKASPQKHVHR